MEKDSIKKSEGYTLSSNEKKIFDRAITRVWLHFVRDRRWSRKQKHQLLSTFGTPDRIFSSSHIERAEVIKGRSRDSSLNKFSVDERLIESDLSWLEHAGVHLIVFGSEEYPDRLSQIPDPPLALFAWGNISLLSEPQVAIVGSRRPTPVGSKVSRQLAQELSVLGLVITSGMALGVDGLSHQGALDASGSTIAVMGCGLDTIYPFKNKYLFENIKENGLLVSEYPVGFKPSKYTFPERNRIVSGLSLGVIVVEAAEKSGTMITARLSVEQDRELMVVPGSAVSAQYKGSHRLIREGAALVGSSKDVLFVLGQQLSDLLKTHRDCSLVKDQVEPGGVLRNQFQSVNNCEINEAFESKNNESKEASLLDFIGSEPISMEMLIINSGLTPAEVSSIVLMLELEDKITMTDDGNYINMS